MAQQSSIEDWDKRVEVEADPETRYLRPAIGHPAAVGASHPQPAVRQGVSQLLLEQRFAQAKKSAFSPT